MFLLHISQNIDGFRQNIFTMLLEFITIYTSEKLIFTIYQNFTLALRKHSRSLIKTTGFTSTLPIYNKCHLDPFPEVSELALEKEKKTRFLLQRPFQ